VALAVEHQTSNNEGTKEDNSSNDQESNGPGRQQGNDIEDTLLISVGEVVVTSAHVIVSSSGVHFDNSSIEVLVSCIEFHAILDIFLGSVGISSVLEQQLGLVKAVVLIKHGKSNSHGSVGEHNPAWVCRDPCSSNWVSRRWGSNLDNVASVSLVSSFSSISGWVLITSSPLEVNVISNSGVEIRWDKVILSGWVGLDNVSSLSSDVQVKHTGQSRDISGSLGNVENKRSVLEGSSVLTGIHGQLEVDRGILGNDWVLQERRVGSIVSVIHEAR